LSELNSGINEDRPGRYQVNKALSKIKEDITFLNDEERKLNMKYFEREVAPGKFEGLREGMTIEDYRKEKEEFYNQETDVEIYKIKLSCIENARIINVFQKEIPWPGDYFNKLEAWLDIDVDYEKTFEVPKPDIPKKIN